MVPYRWIDYSYYKLNDFETYKNGIMIQPGKVLYEMDGVPEELAREAFKLAAAKLPIKTTFVTKTVM